MVELICILISLLTILMITFPFFAVKNDNVLSPSSVCLDGVELRAVKKKIIKRYIEDEKSFQEGELSKVEWKKRRNFLRNRYIDYSYQEDSLVE